MGSVRCQMEDECRSSDCRMESLSDGGHTDPSYAMWLANGIFSQSKNYQLIAMKVSFLLMQQHLSIDIVVPQISPGLLQPKSDQGPGCSNVKRTVSHWLLNPGIQRSGLCFEPTLPELALLGARLNNRHQSRGKTNKQQFWVKLQNFTRIKSILVVVKGK